METKEMTPASLLETSGGYWRTCALHAGVVLDVFTAIGESGRDAGEVARKTGCDERATAMLLNALAAMGLLEKEGETYRLGPEAREFLVKDSPRYIGYIIGHHHRLMESWAKLPEAVKSGGPVRSGGPDDGWREDFLLGMFNLAMTIAPKVAASIDLPTSQPFARSIIERFKVGDRVRFLPGDFLQAPIPGTYDAAWLSHILHAESPEDCRLVLGKAAKALNPGGLLFIHEFILNDAMDGPEFPALFSLNMLLGTRRGQAYSERQLRDMLAGAGARDIRRLDFKGPNDSGILCGTVG